MSFIGGLLMKPERRSLSVLGAARSKAKMYEYDVPENYHIKILRDPARLFSLAIGMLGDLSSKINSQVAMPEDLAQEQKELIFAAQFFDTYMQGNPENRTDPYLILLGSAAYYLCDLPGSSKVLISYLEEVHDIEGGGLEELVYWLLRGDFSAVLTVKGPYGDLINQISSLQAMFCQFGTADKELFELIYELRNDIYINGTPRQLLLIDVATSILVRRYQNSTWVCLPQYTSIALNEWSPVIQQEAFIKELWPAQHLLGKSDIYRGKSAVIQMPTSAGKTKATEIIIRSAFLAHRTNLAVIIAPFRALCHEIRDDLTAAFRREPDVEVNELTDVPQNDFGDYIIEKNQVLITTPEKLVYVIRHSPVIAESIGLLIFDEGHQFDSGTRGVTYELLLSSLKRMVSEDAQTVLISAVIKNAEAIGDWLNEGKGIVVPGLNMTTTNRSVAFTSWVEQLGRLQFVNYNNPEEEEFFVPRIIERHKLKLKKLERRQRFFPDHSDSKSIALYLGLKLVHNGGVAIFCGTKSIASGFCEQVVDVFERGLPLITPNAFSDESEIIKLTNLYQLHLGEDAYATHSAALGVLTHHANIPHGIRLAVEYALKEDLAKFVICTSTLAQGVNLPIRYLVVTSMFQGRDQIKVRDFHNLIGRAGRSGKYTEGSILFADPNIYDGKSTYRQSWRWELAKDLLNPLKSEPCASALLTIFDQLQDPDGNIEDIEPLSIVEMYVNDDSELYDFPEYLQHQINWKISIISAIESFLLSHWHEENEEFSEGEIESLATTTLAFHLATADQKQDIIHLFNLLAENVQAKISKPEVRKAFGRTLYGVRDSLEIESWVNNHANELSVCEDQEELLKTLWPLIKRFINNSTFNKCHPKKIMFEIALGWIDGESYYNLFNKLLKSGSKIGDGKRPRTPNIDHIVDICDSAFAFDGTLIIGAVCEFMQLLRPDCGTTIMELLGLQKRMKYGVPSDAAITFYELGFSDRVVATELSRHINANTKRKAIRQIRQKYSNVETILQKYPSYYSDKLITLGTRSGSGMRI